MINQWQGLTTNKDNCFVSIKHRFPPPFFRSSSLSAVAARTLVLVKWFTSHSGVKAGDRAARMLLKYLHESRTQPRLHQETRAFVGNNFDIHHLDRNI